MAVLLKKEKNRITIWSNNPTPRHVAKKKKKNYNLKRYMHPSDQSSTIYNSQDMETNLTVHPEMNGSRKCGVYISIEYYSAIKKKEIMPFSIWT